MRANIDTLYVTDTHDTHTHIHTHRRARKQINTYQSTCFHKKYLYKYTHTHVHIHTNMRLMRDIKWRIRESLLATTIVSAHLTSIPRGCDIMQWFRCVPRYRWVSTSDFKNYLIKINFVLQDIFVVFVYRIRYIN